MATDRDWARGYFEQATADLSGVKVMGTASLSTAAMLWQMVFEKYAKAALLRQAREPIPPRSQAGRRFVGSEA